MNHRILLPFAVLIVAPAALLIADELETIDGARLSGTMESISPGGEIAGPGLEAGLKLESLRSIVRATKPGPVKAKYVVETQGGGRLLVDDVTLAEDRFTLGMRGSKEIVLPLEAVRSVALEPDLVMSSFKEALAHPSPDIDRIFVKVEKQIEVVKGLVTALDDKELSFEFDGEKRRLPRERLHGLVLAQAGAPRKDPATITLINGSRLTGKIVALSDGELQLELAGGSKPAITLQSIERIDLRSPRLTYLSDLDPVAEREETILTLPKPWQRNRSVSGKPLTLGNQTFASGLGVHARSELEFEVPAGFDLFVATVGIDAAAQGKGDCEFTVVGDGKSLWSQRVRATDAPLPIRIEIKGIKRLTLRVDPGVDFDLGDHGDWCDARLLKSK